MNIKIYFLLILTLFTSYALSAQSSRDSSQFINKIIPQKILTTRFEKQLNTYNLTGSLLFAQRFGNFAVDVKESYASTMIKSTPNNIKDIQHLTLSTEYSPVNKFYIGVFASNNILSDDRKIGINEASNSSAAFFTRWEPYSSTMISPFFGYTNNRQIGESDYGYTYGAEVTSEHDFIQDVDLKSYFKYQNEDISPRRNLNRILTVDISNNFNETSQNTISASYSLSSKDYYFKTDSVIQKEFNTINNLQSRAETNYFIQDRLLLNDFYKNFIFDLKGRAIWRKIGRDTRYRSLKNISRSLFDVDVEEFRLEFESIANYQTSWLNSTIALLFHERDEKHITKRFDVPTVFSEEAINKAYEESVNLESRKNNISNRASFSFIGNMRLSMSDSLKFSLLQSKLRYDTPSELNYDDRDEILTYVKTEYKRRINSLFDVFVSLEGSINHIVYIFAERSSNNNYKRVIRFGSGGYYHGKYFSSKNSFEVSANYTVYDFQDINSRNRSFSFRQSLFQDSSSIIIQRNLFLNFTGYLKYSEQGDFVWNSFSGRPIRDLREIYLEPKVLLNKKSVSFGVGLRYFNLTTFSFTSKIRVMESDYRSIGPVSEINMKINQRLLLKFYGYYEYINYESDKNRELVTLNMQVDWSL